MQHPTVVIGSFLLMFLFTSCAATGRYVLEEPQPEKSLLVGAVLIENEGVGDLYEARKSNILVKIVGKYEEEGEEVTEVYRTRTDNNGYYMVQNVPPGSYVVKGLETFLVPNEKTIVTAIWEGPTKFYHFTDREFDYAVRRWPPPADEKILDMGILHLEVGTGERGHIVHRVFNSLQNEGLALPGVRYTMPNPVDYYQERFPEWGWFTNSSSHPYDTRIYSVFRDH